MKQPAANPSGDQLIREYLTRVAQAGQRLPKGARMAFIGRIRARIERELGPDGPTDSGRVLTVLESIGEPEELVRAERAKIDAAWVRRRAGSREAAEAAAAAVTAPREYRRLNSRWRPATTQPLPIAPAGQPVGPAPEPATPAAETVGPEARPAAETPAPEASQPPGPELTLAEVGRLARDNVLESLVIVLIGVGGLIFPVLPPVWVLGCLLALLSRVWDARDKWIALLGPIVITAVISVVVALLDRVTGNFVVVYVNAFGAGAGYLLRFSCLACAGYLAWRVYRGPRVKVPPWKRQGAFPGGR
jgi:hypothetical protein